MAVANEPHKFKVKNDVTVYSLLPPFMDTQTVVWNDENGQHKETEYSVEYVKDQFRNDIWTYIDNTSLQEAEHTGGSVNYYKVHVANPTTLPEAYDAEANDIIESLGLTFAEGNLFKAIWRMAADRNGKKKKGNNSVYDAEKLVFFAERVLVHEKAKRDETI